MVRKRDGALEPFVLDKVVAGVGKAIADRDVSLEEIERLTAEVERYAHDHGPVVPSEEIGQVVLRHLRSIDEIIYLRFASVHKGFTGASDFEREMAALDDE